MRRFLFVPYFHMLISFTVFAQDPSLLQQAIQVGLQNNPALQAQRQKIAEAEALLAQARRSPNPNLEIRSMTGAVTGSRDETEFGATYFHPLELAGRKRHRIAAAETELETVRWEIRRQEQEFIANLKRSYSQASAIVLKLGASMRSAEDLSRIHELTTTRANEGEASKLEEGLSDVELQRVKTEILRLQTETETQLSSLRLLVGAPVELPNDSGTKIGTTSKIPDLELLLSTAFNNRADLKAAQLRERSRAIQKRLAQAEGKFNAGLFGGYSFSRSSFDLLGLSASGGPIPLKDKDHTLTGGISISLPVRNNNSGNIQAATARESEARILKEGLQRSIRLEVESAYKRAIAARQAFEISLYNLQEKAHKNLQILKTSYDLGESRLSDVLVEQRRVSEIDMLVIEAYSDLQTALADLELALGTTLTEVSQ